MTDDEANGTSEEKRRKYVADQPWDSIMAAEKSRAEIYREQRPDISKDDAIKAANGGRVAASFNTHAIFNGDGTIAAIAIKFKLGNGTTETVIIDRYPSTILHGIFEQLEKNNWSGVALVHPGNSLQ